MDAIRYLDADTILDYLHNSSETYLDLQSIISYGCEKWNPNYI